MVYRFSFNTQTEELRDSQRNQELVDIPLKPLKILSYLIANSERIISIDELLKNIWPNNIVTKHSVKDYICTLRKHLNDDSNSPTYIETVRGRGYQYIGSIEIIENQNYHAPLENNSSCRVAVLAFEGDFVNRNSNYKMACQTAQLEIELALSKFDALSVVSGGIDLLQFSKNELSLISIGRTLSCPYVLVVSCSLHANYVTYSAKLLIAANSELIWASKHSQQTNEIYSPDSTWVREVVVNVETRIRQHKHDLVARTAIEDMTAMDFVIRADKIISDDIFEYENARAIYQKALELDPYCYGAQCGLAMSFAEEGSCNIDSSYEQALQTAMNIAQNCVRDSKVESKAHRILGFVYAGLKEHKFAEKEFKKAILANAFDTDSLAMYGLQMGYISQPAAGAKIIRRAIEIAGYAPDWYYFKLGVMEMQSSSYEKAIESMEISVASSPNYGLNMLACAYAMLGQPRKAKELSDRYLQLYPDYTISSYYKIASRYISDEKLLATRLDSLALAGFPV